MALADFYKEGYRKPLEEYDVDRVKKIKSLLNRYSHSGQRVLEIGCGSGELLQHYVQHFPGVLFEGMDISNEAIQLAKNQYSYEFRVEDINNRLSYDDNRFNIVLAGEVIEHLYDVDNFFLECRRVLKPGGSLIITTPNLVSWYNRLFVLFGWLPFPMEVSFRERMFGRKEFYRLFGISSSLAVGHLRIFTEDALTEMAAHYGFKIIERSSYCHFEKFLINRLVSRYWRRMAEGMIMVFQNDK
ncbi:MAG: class I SAM-dependent methyltransferase [bacterium]